MDSETPLPVGGASHIVLWLGDQVHPPVTAGLTRPAAVHR
jgi:hypothetical protein